MQGVFISYRRSDAAGYAGRIADYFAREHAQVDVFMDVNVIRPGDDFLNVIRERLHASGAVLALIGDRWLDAAADSGARRLDDANDVVRLELAVALQQGAHVIPILLDNSAMPRAADLPEPLKPLAQRSAFSIRHERFARDVAELAQVLEAAPSRAAPNAELELAGRPVPASVLDALVEEFTGYVGANNPELFMIVEDEQQRFVQFIGAVDGEVLLDLPSQPLSASQIESARRLLLETYDAQTVSQGQGDGAFSFQITVPTDPRYLALLTLEIFQHVYGAPPRQKLKITIDS